MVHMYVPYLKLVELCERVKGLDLWAARWWVVACGLAVLAYLVLIRVGFGIKMQQPP